MTQSIFFDVIARDKASSTFSRIGRNVGTAESGLKRFGRTAGTLAGLVGVAGFGAGMVSFLKDSISEGREAQKVGALTNQVIKSTGGAARVTAAHVGDLANAISKKVGIDDEAIQSGENLLLTFKQVHNEAGRGNQIFDRATRAAVNLSAAGFGSITSTSKQMGKALNDPIKGLTALGRAGVTFTKGQQDQIKKLVETGHALKAQKIILKEVESQVGGAAKAQATAGDKARVAWKNLEEQIGTALLPTVDKLERFMTNDLVPAVSKFVTGMQDGTGAGGDFADGLKTIAGVGKTALRLLDALPGSVKKFGAEGLIAFYAIQKLSGGVTGLGNMLTVPTAKMKQFGAEMTYPEARMAALKTAAYNLGTGLRNLAGAGGLLLVSKSMSEADDSARTMERTLGGAFTGLAVGGPVGAAVGAIAGFATSVVQSGKKSAHGFSIAEQAARAYGDTLGDLTGKMTKNTHATVVQSLVKDNDAAVRAASALGISTDVLANKLMGRKGAQEKVNQAIREGVLSGKMMTYENGGQARAVDVLKQALHGMGQETADGVEHTKGLAQTFKEARAEAAATAKRGRELASALKGVPTKVATQIVQPGAKQSLSGIEKLIDKYKRTPDQVRTLIQALGIEVTDKQMRILIDHGKTLDSMSPTVKVGANTAAARAALGSFGAYLTSITRPRTVTVTVRHPGKPGGVGDLLSQGTGSGGRFAGSGRGSSRMMEDSGQSLGDSYARGVERARMKVKKALDKYGDLASKAADKLSSLKDTQAGFLSTFQSDNLFGADLSSGGGLGALMDFEQKQAQQATQLLADIQRVAGMGLSKSLISQLQSQGTSGAQALHALAGGSASQIQQFNALDAQTQSSLQAAGMFAGNTVRGGNINADVTSAAAEDARLERLMTRLHHLQGDDVVVINIDSEEIIRAIRRRNHRRGVATAGI